MALFDELIEELTKKAKDLAEVATEKAKDLAGAATERAKTASDNAKLKVALLSEERALEKNYKAIGEWFVSEFQGEIPDAVKDVVDAVNASKARIAELKASRDAMAEAAKAEEETPELKTCPVCGAVSNSKFCPDCGAPMDAQE